MLVSCHGRFRLALWQSDVNRNRSGSNYREIFRVAIPVSLEAVFQSSFSFIDQIIVGILGAVAVAAVGLSNSLSFILTLLYSAVGTGSGVFIAQAYGRGNMDEVSEITALGQTAAAILGVCTALPLILFPSTILRLVGAQEEVVAIAAGYLRLFAAAAPMTVMSAVTTATFRSMSDSRTPMAITMSAVALNTLLAFVLVLGFGPFPKLGVIGAGVATLISQALRCVALLVVLYSRKEGMRWYWPFGSRFQRIGRPLLRITYPIALSEMLWGTSTFVYTIVFTRIGTAALASSQIVTTVENIFIVAATGLAPAAVATVGQALGMGSLQNAKKEASLVLRAGVLAGIVFTIALIAASFLLPIIYPKVSGDVLSLTFWGLIIMACVQPAKVLNSVIGTGILPTGGDTKFVLFSHVISSYALGLPVAWICGIVARLGAWTVFGSRALEEVVKAVILVLRYRNSSWHRKLET
jgi:putative MATE family efflux protein